RPSTLTTSYVPFSNRKASIHPSWRTIMKLLKVTLLTAALAVPVGAFAGIPVAVDFSAPSLIEQMMSKIQQAELIAKQVAQIKNQAQMLEGIGSTNAGDLNALLGQMRTAMNQANSIVQQSSQVQEKYKS